MAEELANQLREKIESKMDVAKFFAGFITLLIGILLEKKGLTSLWSRFGIAFLTSSLAFCTAALFAYDRLLMPMKYWSALDEQNRKDGRFEDKPRDDMVRSWLWFFFPAVLCFGIGFLPVIVQERNPMKQGGQSAYDVAVLMVLVAGVIAPIWIGMMKGPHIYRK
jgi:hypothetical protein